MSFKQQILDEIAMYGQVELDRHLIEMEWPTPDVHPILLFASTQYEREGGRSLLPESKPFEKWCAENKLIIHRPPDREWIVRLLGTKTRPLPGEMGEMMIWEFQTFVWQLSSRVFVRYRLWAGPPVNTIQVMRLDYLEAGLIDPARLRTELEDRGFVREESAPGIATYAIRRKILTEKCWTRDDPPGPGPKGKDGG